MCNFIYIYNYTKKLETKEGSAEKEKRDIKRQGVRN